MTSVESDTEILVDKVGKALAGGACVVQYRNKTATRALRSKQAAMLSDLCRKAGVPLIINDDLDLALFIDAEGLHLGRTDTDIGGAREKLGEGKIL